MSRQLFAPLISFCVIFLVAFRSASATILPVTMSWSPVGNPGNAADSTGYGAVPYAYNIGTYDVTNLQYVAFLNANDPNGSDQLDLYNSGMSNVTYGGINFNPGAAAGRMYSAISSDGNHPVNYETWYSAIRFANWLDNGQPVFGVEPTASNNATENGSYTLDGFTPTPSNGLTISRNPGATIVLPSENEWYKAAYYDPAGSGSYFTYPTSSNTAPNGTGPTSTPNSANSYYQSSPQNLTNVGAYSGTTSPYGAFDMGGDVWQWNDTVVVTQFGLLRGARGGSFHEPSGYEWSGDLGSADPTLNLNNFGFRLAEIAPVPEPSTLALAALAGMGLIGLIWRRRLIA